MLPRSYGTRAYAGSRMVPRSYGTRAYASSRALPRPGGMGSYPAGRAIPRYNSLSVRGGGYGYASAGYHGYGGHPGMFRPYFSHSYVRPYGWAPYRPFRIGHPYYSFSPWLSLGFGIWAGYPVPYPWFYLGTYQPTVFGVYTTGSYRALPGSSAYVGPSTYVGANTYGDANTNGGANTSGDPNAYGGASFDIQPADANLFVDEQYVGVVGNFGPTSEPLTLAPGPHRIAIQKDGYRPMECDLTVEVGQVVPYRGMLEKQ